MHTGGIGGGFDDEPMAEMNFIPLIDIALTLVIILMVTTAFVRQPGVSLRLPETATREGEQETSRDLVVAVTQEGKLYLNGQPQDPAALRAQLSQAARSNPSTRVLIKGDRAAPYARVMDVMDLVRQAGLTRIVFPTDPRPAAVASTSIPAPAQQP
jgi:biopolymer transport protein ExbD